MSEKIPDPVDWKAEYFEARKEIARLSQPCPVWEAVRDYLVDDIGKCPECGISVDELRALLDAQQGDTDETKESEE